MKKENLTRAIGHIKEAARSLLDRRIVRTDYPAIIDQYLVTVEHLLLEEKRTQREQSKTNTDAPAKEDTLIGLAICERMGAPVALFSEAKYAVSLCQKLDMAFFNSHKIPREELCVGLQLAIMGLSGVSVAQVTSFDLKSRSGFAANDSHVFPLDYDEQAECWTNSGMANMKGVSKIALGTHEE
jgi:hypothetical protein